MHIIIAGDVYIGHTLLRNFLGKWIRKKDLNSLMRNDFYMYRELLISKEKMVQFCTGKCYRQFHHKTITKKEFYNESINDDIDLMFEDIQLGRMPNPFTWTYLDEAEMKTSISSSKYVSAFCRRETTMIYDLKYYSRRRTLLRKFRRFSARLLQGSTHRLVRAPLAPHRTTWS